MTETLFIVAWVGTGLFAVAAIVIGMIRKRNRKLGLCLKCGYDLRGSKERCPECGTAFETP